MTNQLCLRAHLTQPPHSVLLDARSHVYIHECGGLAYHSQANVTPVHAKNGIYMTAEEVALNIVGEDVHNSPTRVISIENTLNGLIMPIDEIAKISTLARSRGIKMHVDGARLWNASQETGVTLKEYGKHFDSMSLCLSKGIGAPIGSILVGSRAFVAKCRHLRKLFGGGWRQAGSLAAVAQWCIENVMSTMPHTHQQAKRLAMSLQSLGCFLVYPCMTNQVWIDTTATGVTTNLLAEALAKHGIKMSPGNGTSSRIVLHHQITDEAINQFIDTATALFKEYEGSKPLAITAPPTVLAYSTSVQ
jgi:threonine aldolase